MKILKANRREGKTTELVKLSNKEWKYIVCMNRQRVEVIVETARKLGLDIPFPITIKELPIRSPYIKSVLLDDLEDVIRYMIGKNIDIATTSCEIKEINNKNKSIEIKCPKCASKEKETKAFGRQDFRYQCSNCGVNYLVHYESLPVNIEQINERNENKSIDLNNEENVNNFIESFKREYECKWIGDKGFEKRLIDTRNEQVYCTNCKHWDKLLKHIESNSIDNKNKVIPIPCCVCYPYNPEDSVKRLIRNKYKEEL